MVKRLLVFLMIFGVQCSFAMDLSVGNDLSRSLMREHSDNPTEALFKYIEKSDDPSGAAHLITAGADVKAPLLVHTAAEHDRVGVLGCLLKSVSTEERACFIEQKNDIGETPMLSAACLGRWSVVDFLAEQGADQDVTDEDGVSVYTHIQRQMELLCKDA